MKHYKTFIAILFSGLILSAAQGETSPTAEVLAVSGTVELKLSDEASYVPAEEGVSLQAGDQIKTASNSYVELGFNEQESNIVRLDSDSYATLVLKGEEQLELLKGKAFATIASLPAATSFEIRTPTAVVGVRGTDWMTAVGEDSTDVEAYEGNPYIKSMKADGTFAKELTVVTAGFKTQVRRFKPPLPMQKIPPQVLLQWKDKRVDMLQRVQANRDIRKQIPALKRRMQMKESLQKLNPNQLKPNLNQLKPNLKQQKPPINKLKPPLPLSLPRF